MLNIKPKFYWIVLVAEVDRTLTVLGGEPAECGICKKRGYPRSMLEWASIT